MLDKFTNQYSVTKTLKFKLRPMGRTLEHIQNKGFVENDEKLATNYKRMKKTIDVYHKDFIARALSQLSISNLDEFLTAYEGNKKNPDDKTKKQLVRIQDNLRKQITSAFTAAEFKTEFSELFKKELLTKNLESFVLEYNKKNDTDLFFVDDFKNFATYFIGFHENRKNIYSADAKHTALAFRIIHENLPKFIENMNSLQLIKDDYPALYESLQNQVSTELSSIFSAGFVLDDVLNISFYNELLSQQGIDRFNQLIGGLSTQSGAKKTQGLNELINEYNQQSPRSSGNRKAPKIRPLYKQILSDRGSLSFLPEKFADDRELYDAINDYYLSHLLMVPNDSSEHTLLDSLKHLVTSLPSFDLTKIYLKNDKAISSISNRLFGDYSVLPIALGYYYDHHINPDHLDQLAAAKSQKKTSDLYRKKDAFTKGYHSVATIELAYQAYLASTDSDNGLRKSGIINPVQDYFTRYFVNEPKEDGKPAVDLLRDIDNKYTTIKGVLNSEIEEGTRQLLQKGAEVANIKHFLDAIMNLIHFVKPLGSVIEEDSLLDIDARFYNDFLPLYEELKLFFPLYNKVRDYISQKPYSNEKFKLNFENANLLAGWDVNKERDRLSVLLQRNGRYYLALMDKSHKKVFEQAPEIAPGSENSNNPYQKMRYKLLPGPNKMFPKVFFAKGNIDYFAPSKQLIENYEKGTHKKGDDFNLEHCHQLIDFFKQSVAKHKDWHEFGFKFSDTSTYKDSSDFYNEVSKQGYKVTFEDVDADYIDTLVENGQLYLFEIYNKDFSVNSRSKPNLHTIYFKALFDDENLKDAVYKLNGEGELFYRKASIDPENTINHKKGERVYSKNPLTPDASRVLDYEIVKDKRYTADKFLLHLPVTMNFKADGIGPGQFNNLVKDTIRDDQNKDMHLIGIDRGERHLLYLTVINQDGLIIHQESLNDVVSSNKTVTPYHTLLDTREKERDDARKNWGVIENIKDLKKGYLSQVVHKLAKLIYEYNAVVVLEDLNFGFKRGRFKVEKQVYQAFEKALIDKLNYLVFKEFESDALGGARKALQLTSAFTAFKDLGKQTGFLFYVPAWNTSKIDPVTGFVDLLKPKYENVEQAKDFIDRFDSIRYNKERDFFEFEFDYSNFGTRAQDTRTDWTICSHGTKRYVYDKKANNNKGGQKQIDVNTELKALFSSYDIDYHGELAGRDLRPLIKSKGDKSLYSSIIFLLRTLLAMRYSKTNGSKVEDFILSPVSNDAGVFFDTRDYAGIDANSSSETSTVLPKDADANGAYHIALKGLWVMRQIQSHTGDDYKGLDLKITNKNWLEFVQTKPYQK